MNESIVSAFSMFQNIQFSKGFILNDKLEKLIKLIEAGTPKAELIDYVKTIMNNHIDDKVSGDLLEG